MAKPKETVGGQDHWEKRYNPTSRDETQHRGMDNWNPKISKDRPQPHNKINELDH